LTVISIGAAGSIVTVLEIVTSEDTGFPECSSVPLAFPEKVISPTSLAVYLQVNIREERPGRLAEVGIGPNLSTAVPPPAVIKAEGATFKASACPVFCTVIVMIITPPEFTIEGVAIMEDTKVAGVSTVTTLDVVTGKDTGFSVIASVPLAFPEKLIVPPLAPGLQVYVHVKFCELPAGIFAEGGIGPEANTADAVPVVFTVNADGVTLLACVPPVLDTFMVTVTC